MKHSIRSQMLLVFLSLLALMFAGIFACNVWLLEPYYLRDKEKKLTEMYEALSEAQSEGRLSVDDEDAYNELVHRAEKDNLFFLAVNMENREICTNVQQAGDLIRPLDAFLLDRTDENEKVIEETENYSISQTKRTGSGADYLMMRGNLGDGYFFLIQCPLESIQNSVALTNRFMMIVGGVLIIISLILVWFFSKRITDPIRELVDLSERMARLDFEVCYTSGGNNEIGVLGENFNRMSEKLEETISELKSANNRLEADIEQKAKLEQMRNEFLGNVSHELKTPIALIQGYAEGLKEGVSDDPESREFYCDVIMDEARKMNHMVKNLLTLNQLEFGNDEIQFERFNLTDLIAGVLQSMEYFAEQSGAKVQFLTRDPVYVWGDQYKVEQVLRNYVGNAFHHVSGEKIVEVKIEVLGGIARTTVFNNGNPIPKGDLPHIWEKFYKVDKAHTREYGGNGIGLSIVKAIMESMHQKYGVDNYDNGVAFWFELSVK